MNGNNKAELVKPAINVEHRWPVNITEEDLGEFEDAQSYITYNCSLRKFSNAWVSPDSVIYQNRLLVTDTLASQEYKAYYRFRHRIKKIFTAKKIRLDGNKKYLLVTDLWSVGHFHWFCDVLPKLLCIENRVHEFTLLLPDVPYIRNIGAESLSLLQLKFEDIVLMKESEFYKVKNLSYITKVSECGRMHPGLMKLMRNKIIGNYSSPSSRIYISREKAGVRKVLNEPDLINLLKNYGYKILFAEDISLAEQVQIFLSCQTLISIHGAGLTNCIFMPPGSKVIELRKIENGPANVGYWLLADSLDHKYYYYNGIPDSNKPLVGKGCNLSIPIHDFEVNLLSQLT